MPADKKKDVSKKNKILHPNSRKSLALIKHVNKSSNKQKHKMETVLKQNVVAEKMLWIQEHMVPDTCPYPPELLAELLKKYMARHDEELEQIAIKQSIGCKRNRQHASREDILKMAKKREQEEYETCGIEIPDVLNPTQCAMLQKWNADLRYMNNFKFRRFGAKHLTEEIAKRDKKAHKVASHACAKKVSPDAMESENIE